MVGLSISVPGGWYGEPLVTDTDTPVQDVGIVWDPVVSDPIAPDPIATEEEPFVGPDPLRRAPTFIGSRTQALLEAPVPATCGPLTYFADAPDLIDWAHPYNRSTYGYWWGSTDVDFDASVARVFTVTAGTVESGQASASDSLSATNNQVAGVDEMDTVKTDGRYAYVWNGERIQVLQLHTVGPMRLVDWLTPEGSLLGFFLSDQELTVVTSTWGPSGAWQSDSPRVLIDWLGPSTTGRVNITVYDRSSLPLTKMREMSVDGSLVGARMIGDHLFLFARSQIWQYNGSLVMPSYTVGAERHTLEPTEIGYLPGSENQSSVLTMLSVAVGADKAPDLANVLGYAGQTLYVSQNNAYLTGRARDPAGTGLLGTSIYKVPLRATPADCVVAGWVYGRLHNQFSLDDFGGFLRVATTTGSGSTWNNAVTVFDEDMAVVGSIDGLARGERIYAARYMADRLYLVTFVRIDPLFVIDLSDPARPAVLGELKVPGVSDYLHPVAPGFLIGVGRDAVDADGRALFQGVKVSLFDVQDVKNPKELSAMVIGERGTTSLALTDHKAFTWDPAHLLLILPIREFQINESAFPNGVPANAWGEEVWQGAYMLRVSAEKGIRLVAKVSHHDDGVQTGCAWYAYRWTETIQRSFVIGDVAYTVSQEKVMQHSATDGTIIGSASVWSTLPSAPRCPWRPPVSPPQGWD